MDNTSTNKHKDVRALFRDFGEMGQLICSLDWSETIIGDIDEWPYSLILSVGIILASQFPITILWGKEHIMIYNNSYRSLLGSKHPTALGRKYFDFINNNTAITKNILDDLVTNNTKSSIYFEDELFKIEEEDSALIESYYTLCISPILDPFYPIGGLLIVATETTNSILEIRRSTLLTRLNQLANITSIRDCCHSISKAFESSPIDIPLGLIYLMEHYKRNNNNNNSNNNNNDEQLILQSSTGIIAGTRASPLSVTRQSNGDIKKNWPYFMVLDSNLFMLVEDIQSKFGFSLITNDGQEVRRVLVFPISIDSSSNTPPQGVLIVGINPRRSYDDNYLKFAQQIIMGVNNVLQKAQTFERQKRTEQDKTIFFTNASHDFRTPLALMLGPLVDSLNDTSNPLNDIQRERQLMIQKNALQLMRLVNNIMDFSRVEAGSFKMQFQSTDINKMTRDIASLFETAIKRAGLDFIIDIESKKLIAYMDLEMWEKIVVNLLSNAFKFTISGSITVILRGDNECIILKVVDTGLGISEQDLPLIFQRYHQVRNRKGRNIEGSGIGLALIQDLVKLLEGTIDVTSKIDYGTTFTVTVPITPRKPLPGFDIEESTENDPLTFSQHMVEEAMKWTTDSKSIEGGTNDDYDNFDEVSRPEAKLILLADDNVDMLRYIRSILIKKYNVHTTKNGIEAYESACAVDYDLIISDVMMPDLDGFGLIQKLRDNPNTRGIPIILLSARAGEEATIEGLDIGADDYLVKTAFSEKELMARVKNHIELGQFRRYLERQIKERTDELHLLDTAFYEFIDMICHEIRNPLNGISGNWELLNERFHNLEKLYQTSNGNMSVNDQTFAEYLKEMKYYLMNIEECVLHQTRVMDEVILRAQLHRNNYNPTYSVFNPATLMAEIIEWFKPTLSNLGLTIDINLMTKSETISTDANCLKQLLNNLLGCIIRNMDGGGIITANHFVEGTKWYCELKCTKLRADVSLIENDSSTSHVLVSKNLGQYYNTGFGVSISNKLIDLIGGERIAIAENESAVCFSFSIFSKSVPTDNSSTSSLEDSSLDDFKVDDTPKFRIPTKRALVAEDNIINQTLCRALLKKQGYDCIIAKDGKEALEKFVLDTYDFILMDISMPELNGYEVTKKIREIEATMGVIHPVNIIGLSAYTQQERISEAIDAGMDDFISKPATFAKIVRIIEQSLSAGRSKIKTKEDLFHQNSTVSEHSPHPK
jgi:signal transduction histidine kinase